MLSLALTSLGDIMLHFSTLGAVDASFGSDNSPESSSGAEMCVYQAPRR
jgi:hypothetical protein